MCLLDLQADVERTQCITVDVSRGLAQAALHNDRVRQKPLPKPGLPAFGSPPKCEVRGRRERRADKLVQMPAIDVRVRPNLMRDAKALGRRLPSPATPHRREV